MRHAQWKNWTRADGTNVTWTNELLHADDIKVWTRKEAERRKKLAAESTDIDVSVLANIDVHLIQTQYRQHAVEEKLKRHAAQHHVNMEEWTRRNMALALADENENDADQSGVEGVEEGRRVTKHDKKKKSKASSSKPLSCTRLSYSPAAGTSEKLSQRSATASTSQVPSSSQSTSLMTPCYKVKGKKRASLPADVDSPPSRSLISNYKGKKRTASSSSSHVVEEPQSARAHKRPRVREREREWNQSFVRRKELERQWSAVTRRARAAAVRIMNDVDDEAIPPLVEEFRYIEAGSSNVPIITDKEVFVRCECRPSKKERCSVQCTCQELSELYINGEKALAYTRDQCSCDPHKCPNRVAQQPRDVPIEVFKTPDRGWGVRSPVYVERGKVLGIYTGRRGVARTLAEEDKAYLFDVDGREGEYPDADDPPDLYTVDASAHGNWTRFLNHSCDPNLIVFLVVYDTIPDVSLIIIHASCCPFIFNNRMNTPAQMNMPYIAFAATKDIPAGTEFSFDYDPIATKQFRERRRGGKGNYKSASASASAIPIPKGRKMCSCGAGPGLCRGYV
ncbi:hypothetical protein C0992_010018 [Termitomyces sp. T32_za158]|nr:hypothetical protein C0992_010018 [Termitomyces sp. T32_za158]